MGVIAVLSQGREYHNRNRTPPSTSILLLRGAPAEQQAAGEVAVLKPWGLHASRDKWISLAASFSLTPSVIIHLSKNSSLVARARAQSARGRSQSINRSSRGE